MEQSQPPSVCYSTLTEFQNRVSKLKLGVDWSISYSNSLITITCSSPNHLIPKYEIFVEPSLRFTLRIFGWMLTDGHELYQEYSRSFSHVTLSSFINDIEEYVLCQGITSPDQNAAIYIKKHVIPKSFSFPEYSEKSAGSRFTQVEYFRSIKCEHLVAANDNNICSPCNSDSLNITYEHNRKESRLND